MEVIYKLFLKAVIISSFVFIMMVVIEYINVQSKGVWQKYFKGNKFKQYIIASLLGAIPGCLGAFTIVALFSHRMVSFGALVTAMIATSGDEAFVMFAMFPKQALLLTFLLFALGILAGYLTDKFYKPANLLNNKSNHKFELHSEKDCLCFQKNIIWSNIIHPSFYRLSLSVGILALIIGLLTGAFVKDAELWIRITLLFTFLLALFILITVPNHFLKEHIWKHIVKVHLPRIFLWVFGVLLIMHFLTIYINLESWISNNIFIVLLVAVVAGFIPESGPHLVFVTLFASGTIPFSILLANSISQDGHGMLPLLAESKKGFAIVKLINILYAFAIGGIGLFFGF
ncbi:putative manganese transporter [Lutibacter sp. TH_r2]|uniref:putative manganese transporter n=1 Tax=Lutibacter sp. TH_r2 TaxID=3082083 RepID=UPI002953E1FD|nr:putative manganese transporter [Lutibacter sp. TH_r2]MDV7186083.1 putative manganese transporter [Lutibacter sp. TH_r2]